MRVKPLISSAIVASLLAGCSDGQNSPSSSTSYEVATDAISDGAPPAENAEKYKTNDVSPVRAVAEAMRRP